MDFSAIMQLINSTAAPIAFAVLILLMWREDLKRNDERETNFLKVIQANTDALRALKEEIRRMKA